MKAALYARVSSQDQNCELQVRDLRSYAERQGWEVADVYQDVASGVKVRRSALDRLMSDAGSRKFDCVLCWKLDRFGRSLVHCLNHI